MDKLTFIIDLLDKENDKLFNLINCDKEMDKCDTTAFESPLLLFLQHHRNTLIDIITQLRYIKVSISV